MNEIQENFADKHGYTPEQYRIGPAIPVIYPSLSGIYYMGESKSERDYGADLFVDVENHYKPMLLLTQIRFDSRLIQFYEAWARHIPGSQKSLTLTYFYTNRIKNSNFTDDEFRIILEELIKLRWVLFSPKYADFHLNWTMFSLEWKYNGLKTKHLYPDIIKRLFLEI